VLIYWATSHVGNGVGRRSCKPAPLAPSRSVRRPSLLGTPLTRHGRRDERVMALQAFPGQPKDTHKCGRYWWSSRAAACHWISPRRPESTGPDFPFLMLQMYVKCFRCFRCMLQLLHIDKNVAHVAYFCKCFQWYVASVLKKNVPSVLDVCCNKCFIWMLHMFHTNVASVLSRCCICFTHICCNNMF
jgi:hypothetical protein